MSPQPEPDGEFEVSDLRAERPSDAQDAPNVVSRSSQSNAVLSALARRITPTRRRLLGGALAIIGVALVLALALGEYSAATLGATTGAASNTRSPAATLLYFVNNAPWGVLRVNGRVVDMNRLLSEQSPLFLNLGATTLDYNAPPYPILHCVISNPPARRDTCPLISHYAPQDPVQQPSEGRLIDLRANLNRLTSTQFAAMEQTTEAALATAVASDAATFTPTITLAPGDHYLNAQGQVSVATQPMRARLQLTFDRGAPVNAECRVFCMFGMSSGLEAPITPTWAYTAVGADAPIATGPYLRTDNSNIPDSGDSLLQLDVQWQNGWRVTVEPTYLLAMGQSWCNDGALALQSLTTDQNLGDIQGQGVGDAQGCSYVYQPQSVTTPQNPGAVFLFRCGVVLSANVAAQQFLPKLPMASTTEAQMALSMAGERYAAP